MPKLTEINSKDELVHGDITGHWTTVEEVERFLTPQECAAILAATAQWNILYNGTGIQNTVNTNPYYQCWLGCVHAVARRA